MNVIFDINDLLWSIVAVLVCALGVFYAFSFKLAPVLRLRRSMDLSAGGEISAKSALFTLIAGSVGTGNIAGVVLAISIGGAGAIFWMWVSALLGMCLKTAECIAGGLYKRNGRGGMMYALHYGAKKPRLAQFYAFATVLVSLFMGNAVQSNTAAVAISEASGLSCTISGAVIALVTLAVVWRGISGIAKATDALVPLMAALYILAGVIVIGVNWQHLPAAFGRIFGEAFHFSSAAGGAIGVGFSRGVMSHESGLGSAATVTATQKDSVKAGYLASFSVFFDTIVVCTVTALALLTTGQENASAAFSRVIPRADILMATVTTMFAVSSMFAWCFLGERALLFLIGEHSIKAYRIGFSIMAFVGAALSAKAAWVLGDIANALLCFPNAVALIMLRKEIRAAFNKTPL